MKGSNFIWYLISVFSGFLLAGVVILLTNHNPGESIKIIAAPTPAPIKVFISGNIDKPGVYELTPESRLEDLFLAASVDEQFYYQFNLASKLYDGQHIKILTDDSKVKELIIENSSKININEANIEDLMSLPGIGETRAKEIIMYRESNGYFDRIEDILNVPGIGNSTFNQIKENIETNSIKQ
jgi:competence protein ComEA